MRVRVIDGMYRDELVLEVDCDSLWLLCAGVVDGAIADADPTSVLLGTYKDAFEDILNHLIVDVGLTDTVG
jgi:hypothetical protein